MSLPLATYRLQLRDGMTFDRAAELAPYLARLGVSHLYLSPIFRARAGSAHGYDAIDFNEIEPEIGGLDGFRRLAHALKSHGLGVVLDIVPNHMGATPENKWWGDVLEWGADSAYAGHFDIDWSAGKLIVPALGLPYGEVLETGEIRLESTCSAQPFAFVYHDLRLPITPPSFASVLQRVGNPDLTELERRFASSTRATAGELKSELEELLKEPGLAQPVSAACAEISADRQALHALHEAQVWRLAHWRTSRESLTYRRFFEISDLVGVRVEVPQVFDDVHGLILRLAEEGLVDGLRIDHVDGLADPLAYLKRLRSALSRDDLYLVVEKILGPDELVRADWPVAGTTGYEVIRDLALLLVDGTGEPRLTRGYSAFIGQDVDFRAETLAVKRRTFTRNLAGELEYLTGLAGAFAAGDIAMRDLGRDTLRRAIVELASALRVYRTYVDAAGPRPEDIEILEAAAASAKRTREEGDGGALEFRVRLMRLEAGPAERQAQALAFTTRFQQTTGPLMAKALEDTLFYRYNRLIALNEVGGEPEHFGATADRAHEVFAGRARIGYTGLSTTATHDTKRGEDARARIYAISEMADEWGEAVQRWHDLNAPLGEELEEGPVPEPASEWMLYQSLLGVWPLELMAGDAKGLGQLAERMERFMRKAAREAKLRTSWTQPAEAYERALSTFVRGVLDPQRSSLFIADFLDLAEPLMRAGALNGLAQTAIKILGPGIADIYQGTELWDFSLVDPDNRRPVDYARRETELERPRPVADLVRNWTSGALKLRLIEVALALRHAAGRNFATADYVPLSASGALGEHVFAFGRVMNDALIVVIVPRLSLRIIRQEEGLTVPSSVWGETAVELPSRFKGRRLMNALSGETLDAAGHVRVKDALAVVPVALLTSTA